MSFFDDEEDLHDEGLCDPAYCRFCAMDAYLEGDYDPGDDDDSCGTVEGHGEGDVRS